MKFELPEGAIDKNWHGITHPAFNGWMPEWFYFLWKRLCCSHGWHLLDETASCLGHFLYCDACSLDIRLDDNDYDKE